VPTLTLTTAYTVTDGRDFVAGGYPLPRVWATRAEAEADMRSMCWHPDRFAGPFRVEAVRVAMSTHGTVLDVSRPSAPVAP
jgi:hypothetical protein